MSNTRNRTANIKKRKEKGVRGVVFGSKPHSNGEAFSRSFFRRAAKDQAIKAISVEMKKAEKKAIRGWGIVRGYKIITF